MEMPARADRVVRPEAGQSRPAEGRTESSCPTGGTEGRNEQRAVGACTGGRRRHDIRVESVGENIGDCISRPGTDGK